MRYKLYYFSMALALISLVILNEEFKKPEITPLAVGLLVLNLGYAVVAGIWLWNKKRSLSNTKTGNFEKFKNRCLVALIAVNVLGIISVIIVGLYGFLGSPYHYDWLIRDIVIFVVFSDIILGSIGFTGTIWYFYQEYKNIKREPETPH